MFEDDKIPFPNHDTIQREINMIVAKGVIPPESFHKLLERMYQQIGLRFLMRDTREISVAVMMMVMLMGGIVATGQENPGSGNSFYGLVMVLSPILYGLLSMLPFLSSKLNGTMEVEMTSKYNFYQIAAFRMLVFSVFCFILNTVWVLSLALRFSTVEFVQAFMISTTSLLVFSLLFLYALSNLRTLIARIFVLSAWLGVNGLLHILDYDLYQWLLLSLPWYLYTIVMMAAGYLYVRKLKEFMLVQKERSIRLC